ncbi:MAG: hypothetical protein R6X29_11835 [Acidimicrobiia bacterium]|jgi:hypothetical protein
MTETPVDLRAVTDPKVDPLVPGGRDLVRFVDAALAGGRADLRPLAGWFDPEATVMAAAVVANFQMMNRVADATGMPVGTAARARGADLIDLLGLDRFDHSEDEE